MSFDREKWRAEVLQAPQDPRLDPSGDSVLALLERAYAEGRADGEAGVDVLVAALRNVRLLVASRRGKIDKEVANALLRFCSEAGIVGDILRGEPLAAARKEEGT